MNLLDICWRNVRSLVLSGPTRDLTTTAGCSVGSVVLERGCGGLLS